MFDLANDIQSLSHFKRKSAELMKRLKKTGNPLVLTVNGKAQIIVQDAAAYQQLVERAEQAEMIEFLNESKADAEAGRTVPAREFLQSLGKKPVRKKK